MDYKIELVVENDLPTLGHLIHSAKLALSINRLIFLNWPNEILQSSLYSQAVKSGHENASAECFKAVDNNTQDIIGYIVLARVSPEPEEKNDKEEDTPTQVPPEGLNPPLLAEVNGAVGGVVKSVQDKDHFEVRYMCVKPFAQRHGIGSKLVHIALDRARVAGIPLFVCAEAPSIPFFTALGFKETGHVDIDLRKYAPDNSGFGIFRLAGMIWHH
ncbi:hypothetical protein N7478_001814 [Penicillium angulare]|uniref:uncharacterized protein n=1 Tax=Penicillium angulare TaxID=116970 RepID=UPI00253F660F|nr:uncharacterized protein N7478_001814 [Penicillium angulare]KAJ5288784.1 hypothetical protein N7478_001814 [Penicillium angulare]